MDIVEKAVNREGGYGRGLWQIELVTSTMLVGTLVSLGDGAYAIYDGQNKYFSADKVVRINLD